MRSSRKQDHHGQVKYVQIPDTHGKMQRVEKSKLKKKIKTKIESVEKEHLRFDRSIFLQKC